MSQKNLLDEPKYDILVFAFREQGYLLIECVT